MVITHFWPIIYGAERAAYEIAVYLASKGVRVSVITGRWQSDWPKFETHKGVEIHRVPMIRGRIITTLFAGLSLWWQTRSFVKKVRPDTLVCHIFPALLLPAYLPKSLRTVITIQGGDLADYPELYGPLSPIIGPIIGWHLTKARKVHVVSSSLQARVKALSGVEAVRLPNGIESLDWYQKLKPERVLPNHFQAISTSRLTPKNNLLETVKAVKLVRDSGIDLGMVIAGEGQQEAELRKLVASLGLQSEMRLLSRVDHRRALRLVKGSDVFVRVSLQEGFGISVLEAMAAGVPVVASRAGGLVDFVSSKTAVVPSSTKAKDIAKALIEATKPQSSRLKAATAMAHSLEWQSLMPEYRRLYEI